QYLAWRALRSDHIARRPADGLTVALRGCDARRRDGLAAVPSHHLSAADADHCGRHDILGAVHVHRLPADLGDDPRRTRQCHAPDGHAVLPARDPRQPTGRGSGDLHGDDSVSVGRHPDLVVRAATTQMAAGRERLTDKAAITPTDIARTDKAEGLSYLDSLPR